LGSGYGGLLGFMCICYVILEYWEDTFEVLLLRVALRPSRRDGMVEGGGYEGLDGGHVWTKEIWGRRRGYEGFCN
jgi:hypothetical protein